MFRFLKTTVLGGILFLIPIVVFLAVIGKGLELTHKLATPLAEKLPVDFIGAFAMVHILTVVILIALCFFAGLAARAAFSRKLVKSLEVKVLDKIPAYELIKAKTQSALSPDEIKGLRPAMTRFDDSWQLAFEIEHLADGRVVVFLPGSPDPWSGSVCVVTGDRVTLLDITAHTAAHLMKRLGRGATETLKNAEAFSDS